jgi:hypothetical protein
MGYSDWAVPSCWPMVTWTFTWSLEICLVNSCHQECIIQCIDITVRNEVVLCLLNAVVQRSRGGCILIKALRHFGFQYPNSASHTNNHIRNMREVGVLRASVLMRLLTPDRASWTAYYVTHDAPVADAKNVCTYEEDMNFVQMVFAKSLTYRASTRRIALRTLMDYLRPNTLQLLVSLHIHLPVYSSIRTPDWSKYRTHGGLLTHDSEQDEASRVPDECTPHFVWLLVLCLQAPLR